MKKSLESLDLALAASRRRPYFNVLRVANPVKEGETITFGSRVFEADINGSVTSGRTSVALAAAASLIAASLTGTFSGTGTANDTITVAGQVYKLVDTLADANDVLIGADAGETRDNLVAAINGDEGEGTLYGTGTVANASVSAAASSTANIVLTALVKGTVGNSIAVSESGTGFSFAGAATTLASGADASASDFTTAFTTAVNTLAGLKAFRISANEVLVVDLTRDGPSVACSETLTGTNNAWASATSYAGEGYPNDFPAVSQISRVPNATEIALETMHFFFNFVPASFIVQVRTSAGVAKAWDGAAVLTSNRLTLTSSGSTDIASGDVVTVHASA